MAVRKKPKNDFGVELMAFCATYGLTYRDVATGADGQAQHPHRVYDWPLRRA